MMEKYGELRLFVVAVFDIEYFSNCIRRPVSLKVIIPIDRRYDSPVPENELKYHNREMKTLFLLHGYTGKGDCWVPDELIQKYHFAVVCPNGENSFWLNGKSTGHAFQSMVGEEIVEFVRQTFGLAQKREDTYICGFSMGGFGAFHTALAYPEVFSKTIALSSAFIQKEVSEMKPDSGNDVANYDYYQECFGDPEMLRESDNMPETLVKKILSKDNGALMPEIYMACGCDDFLIENNRDMHAFLKENNVEHTYLEWPGIHDMKFWTEAVEKFIPIIME